MPAADGRREHLPRPPLLRRGGAASSTGGASSRSARGRSWTQLGICDPLLGPRGRPLGRRAAAGRDRQGALAERRAADPGRADDRPRQRGDRTLHALLRRMKQPRGVASSTSRTGWTRWSSWSTRSPSSRTVASSAAAGQTAAERRRHHHQDDRHRRRRSTSRRSSNATDEVVLEARGIATTEPGRTTSPSTCAAARCWGSAGSSALAEPRSPARSSAPTG